jgi:hypothetical protein
MNSSQLPASSSQLELELRDLAALSGISTGIGSAAEQEASGGGWKLVRSWKLGSVGGSFRKLVAGTGNWKLGLEYLGAGSWALGVAGSW